MSKIYVWEVDLNPDGTIKQHWITIVKKTPSRMLADMQGGEKTKVPKSLDFINPPPSDYFQNPDKYKKLQEKVHPLTGFPLYADP